LKATTLVVLLVAAAVLYYLSPAVFFIVLFIGLLYTVGYYKREKCPSCGSRGTIALDRSEVLKTERAYGIVTRTESTTNRRRDSQGKIVNEESTSEREERAPIVRTTSREYYKCRKCGHSYSRESVDEEEDFSRNEEPSKEKVIIEREVVKVPCKYCGTLSDPVRNSTCPKCGAKLL
jgi:DNA-directed RNA polymerase subunit M/transcription elongation factor TFIIS